MFLAVDIGNTHIVAGIYDADKLVRSWRFSSDVQKTEDEYLVLLSELLAFEGLQKSDIREMAIASVVPSLTFSCQKMARKFFDVLPLVVDCNTDTGMPILMDYPNEVGADRIINAMAAYNLYGGPLTVFPLPAAISAGQSPRGSRSRGRPCSPARPSWPRYRCPVPSGQSARIPPKACNLG